VWFSWPGSIRKTERGLVVLSNKTCDKDFVVHLEKKKEKKDQLV
jgi:hypothetical protein